MSKSTYTVSLHIEVGNKLELYRTARAKLTQDGMSATESREMLKPDGSVDVGACLRTLFDPGQSPAGCSILDSTVQGPGDSDD